MVDQCLFHSNHFPSRHDFPISTGWFPVPILGWPVLRIPFLMPQALFSEVVPHFVLCRYPSKTYNPRNQTKHKILTPKKWKKNQMSTYLIWAYYANIMLLVSKLVTKFKLQRPRSHIMKNIQQIFFTKSDSEIL